MQNNVIVSGVIWSFLERIIAQVVSFIVSIILARILLPDDYGVVAILLIFITLADVFVSNGFGTALIQDREADKDDFSTIFYCSLTISIVIYIVLFCLAPMIANFYKNNAIINLMRVLAIRIPISSYNTIQKSIYLQKYAFQKFFYITLIGTTISAVVGIYLSYQGVGAWALVAQYLTNTIVDSITLTFIVDWKPRMIFKVDRAKKLMSYGWKVLVAELIGTCFDQLQSLIISAFFAPADLAYYNKGNQIPSMISSNVNNSVMTVLFPVIANKGNSYDEVKLISKRSIRMMVYIVFPIMIGLALVSRPLILILLTDKWAESIQYMTILCFAVAFTLVGNTGLQTIKAIGRSDILLKIELYKKPVFLLSIFIGLQFGVIGVAASTLLYSFYAMVINFGAMGKMINYKFTEQVTDLVDVGKLAAVMGIIVYVVNYFNISNNWIELILKTFLGVISYIVLSKISRSAEYTYILNFIKLKIHR